jgi:hypothetical protein
MKKSGRDKDHLNSTKNGSRKKTFFKTKLLKLIFRRCGILRCCGW